MAVGRSLQGGGVRDLSGGINLRDAASELAQNELADAWNITLDERGGAASRLGYVKDNATAFSGGTIVNQFWSQILGQKITQAGPSLFLGTINTVRKTFSTSATVTFCEMNSRVVAAHPADGLFTSTDGITWTAVADPDAPTAGINCVFVFQSKVFVGMNDGKARWSVATDPTSWVSTDFNALWEKDQTGLVAMHVGSGQDIQGRPGLLCFKQESTYRIDDSATGSYTTVDGTVGAAGPLAVVGIGSKVYALNKNGVWWWREDQIGMVNASDLERPLWDPAQVDDTSLASWCAGRWRGHGYFSLRRHGSTSNDLAFEHDPDMGWFAPRSDAMTCYATSTGSGEILYGGSPTASGRCYQLNSGGTDDGAAIAYRIQTRWFELNNGFQVNVWQIRIHGRGTGTLTTRTDFDASGGNARDFTLTNSVGTWDDGGFWDDGGVWETQRLQETEAFYSVGVCRQFSLIFSGTTSTTYTGVQLLGAGPNLIAGSFALYGLEWLAVPLGLS